VTAAAALGATRSWVGLQGLVVTLRRSRAHWPDANGTNFVDHIAGVEDLQIAMDTYRSAVKQVKRWPGVVITLRQGARVVEDSRQARTASLTDKGREGGR
jgi:hypothetical protein